MKLCFPTRLGAVLLIGLFAVSCAQDDNQEDNTPDVRADIPTTGVPVQDPPTTTEDPVIDPVVDPVVDPADPMDPMDPVIPSDPCLAEAGCFNTFPTQIVDTTTGGTRSFDAYSCRPETNESGPERLYRLDLPHAGFLAIEVTDEGAGADVDVHLLLENDSDSCMDRGNLAAGAYLEAGTYWVAADSWVDEEGIEYAGDFELSINLVRPQDLTPLGMKLETATDALTAFRTSWQRSETKRFEYTITDFSIHSRLKRQWVVQLATGELLFNLTVGHGVASIVGNDLGVSSVFSNTPESHQSSLGLIRTAETYFGDYGYSLRLDGLEPGFNDKVRDRFIVVHPWYGNRVETVATEGWVVPTWGCATVDPVVSEAMINTISGGSLMFFWYPDPTWRNASTYL